jgi:hypothetical protein
MTSPVDPRAIVRGAKARIRVIPAQTVTPPTTPGAPDPTPIVVPERRVLGPADADIPDALRGVNGTFSQGAGLGLLWALLQSLEIRAVTGHLTITAPPAGGVSWPSGGVAEKLIVWDQEAPEAPTGVLISVEAGLLTAGKTVGVLKPGSATRTGATLILTNVSGGPVIPSATSPITYNAQALYLWTPPMEEI